MTHAASVVLRDVRVDPRPRTLGVGSATLGSALHTEAADTVPPRQDGVATARDEGFRRGSEETRRACAAAAETERAAQSATHARTLAAAQAEHASRLAETEAARDAARADAAAVVSLQRSLERLIAEAREALLDDALVLAFEATARFVGGACDDETSDDRRRRLQALVVHAAATELRGRPLLRVRLHPADLAVLGDTDSAWHAIADATVDRGGCRLDTAHGSLDARLATRLDRLRSTWVEAGCSA